MNRDEFTSLVEYMYDNQFFDINFRAVFISFNTYNPETNIWTSIIIVYFIKNTRFHLIIFY